MTQDYYEILGVDRDAGPEELRQAYRQKAFELHPDRHGGSPQAEESFKRLNEAYAVLSDPARRSAYDAASRGGTAGGQTQFNPEDMFAEMFRNPEFRRMFEQMAREFQHQGLRFDDAFVRRMFGNLRGPFVFGGFFFVGPLGALLSALFGRHPARPSVHQQEPGPSLGDRKPGLLGRLLQNALPRPKAARSQPGLDVEYHLPVTARALRHGDEVQVSLPGPEGRRTLKVRVPAGSRPGTKLRLPGQGNRAVDRRGDLYLVLDRND